MAFDDPDDSTPVNPESVVEGLIQQAPSFSNLPSPVNPEMVEERLIRKGMPGVKRTQPKPQEAQDFSSFGEPADTVPAAASQQAPSAKGGEDFSQFGEPIEAPDSIKWSEVPGTMATGAAHGLVHGLGATTKAAELAPRAAADAPTGLQLNPLLASTALAGHALKALSPDPRQGPLFRAGEAMQQGADTAFPMTEAQKRSISGRVSEGVGGLVGMAPAIAAGTVMGGPVGGTVVGAAMMGLNSAADTFDAAIQKGSTLEQAQSAALAMGGVGTALGAIPVATILKPAAKFLPVYPGLAGFAMRALGHAAESGIVFAGVGEAQEYLAQQVALEYYDPTAGYQPDIRRVIASLLTGGIAGAATQGYRDYRDARAVGDLYDAHGNEPAARPGIGGPGSGAGPSGQGARQEGAGSPLGPAGPAHADSQSADQATQRRRSALGSVIQHYDPRMTQAHLDAMSTAEMRDYVLQRDRAKGGAQPSGAQSEQPEPEVRTEAGQTEGSVPHPEQAKTESGPNQDYAAADAALVDAGYHPEAIKRWSPAERAKRLRDLGIEPAPHPSEETPASEATPPQGGGLNVAIDRFNKEVADYNAQKGSLSGTDPRRRALAQEIADARAEMDRLRAADTGQNIPETGATLKAQQDQLVKGERAVQMFPKGTVELALPEGMERVETPRGVFHFNPTRIKVSQIQQASAQGRENELLGLGPVSKPEATARAAAGEPPVAVVERQQDGTEVRAAAGTTQTAPAQQAAMEAAKSPGNTVGIETPGQVLADRTAGTGTRESPVTANSAEDIARAAAAANPNPTPAQVAAGNYQKGHLQWNGLSITIENGEGSTRKGPIDKATGEPEWEARMAAPYGYIRRTKGADGDHVDVFLGPNPNESKSVFVLDQKGESGFDEHKSFIGFPDAAHALRAYLGSHDESGSSRLGGMRELSIDEFKQWVRSGETSVPLSDAMRVPTATPHAAVGPENEERAASAPSRPPASQSADRTGVPSETRPSEEERLPERAAPTEGRIEPEHYAAVEQVLRAAGIDAAHIPPVVIAEAAEIMQHEGRDAPDAFQIAAVRQAVRDGLTPEQVEQFYGTDITQAVLHARVPPERGVHAEASGSGAGGTTAETEGGQPARGRRSGAEVREAAPAEGGEGSAHHVPDAAGEAASAVSGEGARRGTPGGERNTGVPEAHEGVAKGPRPPRHIKDPASLLPFIAAQGGLKPTPDLRHLGLTEQTRAIAPNQGPRPVLHKNGITLHDLMERMREAGYLPDALEGQPDDVAERDIMDMIDREIRGDKVLPIGREHEDRTARERAEDESRDLELRDALGRIDDILNEQDIPLDAFLPEDKAAAAELVVQGMSPDDALERAVTHAELNGQMVEPGAPAYDEIEETFHEAVAPAAPGSGEVSPETGGERAGEAEAEVPAAGEQPPRAGEAGGEEWGIVPEVEDETAPEARDPAKWWKDDLTPMGREHAVKAAGLPERVAKTRWHNIAPDVQEKLAAIRGTDSDPMMHAEAPTWAEVLNELPKDANGDRDLDRGFALMKEIAGKTKFDDLTPSQKVEMLRRLKPQQAEPLATLPDDKIESVSAGKTSVGDTAFGKFKGFASTNERGFLAVHAYGDTKAEAQKNAVEKLKREFADRAKKRAAEKPTTEATPAGEQGVLPGAEKITAGEQAQRKADERLKPTKVQRPADEGLFGDTAGQADLVDMARKPPERAPGEKGWIEIGKNAIGQTLYEDHRGVRSYIENGIRHTEPVAIHPGRKGVELSVDHEGAWQTVAEAAPEKKFKYDQYLKDPGEQAANRAAVNALNGEIASADALGQIAALVRRNEISEGYARVQLNRIDVTEGDVGRALAGETPEPQVKTEETPHEGGPSAESPRPLDEVAAGEGGGAQEGGQPEGGPSVGGAGGPGRDGAPAEGGGETVRGGGGGAEDLHPAASRTGSRTAKGPGGRTRRKGEGVSGEPAAGPDRVAPEEAPSLPKQNFRITDEVELGKGSEGVKFKDNLNAITILKAIERDNRRATPDEQRALARYVGWGGLANAFADDKGAFKPDWQARGGELAGLLTANELRAARRSTRNAHYTSKPVIDAMWQAVERLGFKGGLALELSSGTGNFLGLVPEGLAGRTRFIGVEYDSLTQRIAQQLYPQDSILHSGLQHVPLPPDEAMLNVGNPPFGAESLRFRFHPEYNGFSIHNQFFLAGLDALQPGGIHAAVVSRYLLDAQDPAARREMAVRADLIGAIRLPETAFRENARTDVVTDIVFMRRRTPAEQAEMRKTFDDLARKPEKENLAKLEAKVPNWVGTTAIKDPTGGDVHINRYFDQNPHMVVGKIEFTRGMHKENELTITLDKGEDLSKLLDAAVKKLPKNILHQDQDVIDGSLARHKTMARALEIAVKGHEPGHIETTEGGRLKQIYERETPTGGYELAERDLTPATPWSRQLKEDDKGRWYTLEPVGAREHLAAQTAELRARAAAEDAQQNVAMAARLREAAAETEKSAALASPEQKAKTDRGRNVYTRKYFENNDVPQGLRLGIARLKRLKEAVDLRDLTRKQIVLETEDAPPRVMEANRKDLAAAYERFVKRHGLLNEPSNAALVSDMPDGALVMALELNFRRGVSEAKAKRLNEKPKPPSADPAPIMRTRVVPKFEPVKRVATAQDALAVSLSDLGRVDMDRIAGLLDIPKEKAVEVMTEGPTPLTYLDPEEGQHVTRDAYLSGQVARKLNAARGAGLADNVRDLEKVQPARWTADQVNVILGASWVPEKVYAQFAEHLVGGKAVVQHLAATNSFGVSLRNIDEAKHKDWRTDAAQFDWLLSRILNSQPVKIIRTDSEGKTHVDLEATAVAQLKAREIENEFTDWIFRDGDRRNSLVDMFNEKFNTLVNRQFDGSHLKLPGKVPDAIIAFRRNQMNAVWRGIQSRAILLDHIVGAGKTFALIARVMERRRMGLTRKPMIVVPNHLVTQWTQDFLRLYPGAKVLAAAANQFDRDNRRKLFAKIATGDWDGIIVPHSSFGFIGVSPETEMRFLDEELRLAHAAIEEAKEAAAAEGIGGRRKPFNVKEAERLAEKIEGRIDTLKNAKRDRLLTFEQMGIDDLTVDEAHEFKNLFYTSRLVGVRGMGNKTGSAKAFDLYTKMRVLREHPNGSYAFATGTPISNSAVEMYTMLRYLAPNELKELGLENFDAWRAQSVTAEAAFEPTDSGSGLKEVTRLGRSWSNMRALMELWYSVTDAVTQEDLNKWYAEDNNGERFPVPPVKGGNRKEVVVQPTPAQLEMLTEVVAGFNGLPNISDPFERNKQRLRLMDRARKLSLDVRAANPRSASKEEGGKLDQIADNVARIHKAWTADAGTQLVFLDRSVRAAKGDDKLLKEYDALVRDRDKAVADGNEGAFRKIADELDTYDPNEMEEVRRAQAGGWNAYDQLKQNLIARGIPADEIRFVQEANNDAEKKALFDAVNDGLVRVLIGSTPRMGAGTNVQARLVALHHGDVTWKPSDIEQREGRIIRQGNELLAKYGKAFEVEILAYVTERTVDSKMWALNAAKMKMINGVRKYDGSFTMEFDDEEAVSMAEIAALASGDPMLLERVKLQSEIDKLDLLQRAHQRKMYGVEDRIHDTERQIERLPGQIKDARAQSAEIKERLAGLGKTVAQRSMEIEGQKVSDVFDAHKLATDAIEKQQAGDENAKYAVNVGGKRLTSKQAIEDAIREKLGDQAPFQATIDGKTYITRASAAKVIGDKAHDLVKKLVSENTHETVDLGKMLGYDLQLEVSWGRFGNRTLALHLDKGGETVATGEHTRGDMLFTPASARAASNDLEKAVSDRSFDRSSILEGRLADAKRDLPSLMKERGQPFKQAAELSEKRKRLDDVVRELAGRAAAAEGGPREPDGGGGGGARPPTITSEPEGPRGVELAHAAPATGIPGLYSAVEKVVAETPRMDKARADQWMGLLRNKPGIKEEELKWLGLREWLGQQEGQVTRAQVLDFIRANQIELKEVNKGGAAPVTDAQIDAVRNWLDGNVRDDELGARAREDVLAGLRDRNRNDIGDLETLGAPAELLAPLYGEITLPTDIDEWQTGETKPLDDGTMTPLTLPGIAENGTGIDIYHDKDGEVTGYGVFYRGTLMSEATNFDSAVHELQGHLAEAGSTGTSFSGYTLPGGTNYREVLLQMPPRSGDMGDLPAQHQAAMDEIDDYLDRNPTAAPARDAQLANLSQRRDLLAQEMTNREPDAFTESHWSEPNVLAHVRFDDRLTPGLVFAEEIQGDGAPTTMLRTLHVAEIQSDWHQKGRERGYGAAGVVARQKEIERQLNAIMDRAPASIPRHERGDWAREHVSEYRPLVAELFANQQREFAERRAVPDAPFKTTWPELVLKRMLRYAAENGYDRLTWDTGETNADRYDLSKQIDRIEYGVNDDDTYSVMAFAPHGGEEINESNIDLKRITDLFGKEIADKIERGQGQGLRGAKVLRGLDLQVGGEGQREFYDRILPAMARKLVRPFGGEVGRSTVPVGDPRNVTGWETTGNLASSPPAPVHSIDITPAMRAGIMEKGFPLFHTYIDIPRDRMRQDEARRLGAVENLLRGLIRQQVGDHVVAEFPANIRLDSPPHGYGGRTAQEAFGMYTAYDRIIRIALAHGDPNKILETSFHEPFHAIQDFLATDQERALLKASEKELRAVVRGHRLHGSYADDIDQIELEAIAYQIYGAERAAGGSGAKTGLHIGIRRLFEKMYQFFRRLMNAIHGLGFQTWEDYFAKAYEGGLKDRTPRPGSRVAEEMGLADTEVAHAARTAGLPQKMGAPISSFSDVAAVKAHPDYAAAKAGDALAAGRLVEDMVKPEKFTEAFARFGTDVLYTPVVAQEAAGLNKIPRALAELYASHTGADTGRGLVQSTKAYHTGAKAMERLMVRPLFDGTVQPGAKYVLVDDVTVMGSTLAELAHHITEGGGHVVGVVTLVNAARGDMLSARPTQIRELARRFGDAIRDLFHVDTGALTGPEATYLLGFRNVDELRNRAAAAGRQRSERLASKGISPAPVELAHAAGGAQPGPAPNFNQRIRDRIANLFSDDFSTRFIENFSNLSHRVKLLQNDVEARYAGVIPTRSNTGEPLNSALPPQKRFYEMKRLFPGKVADVVGRFNKAHLDPLIKYMKANRIPLKEAGDYLYALHAVERNLALSALYQPGHPFYDAINDPDIVGGSGMSANQAQDIIDRVEHGPIAGAYPEFLRLVDGVREYIHDTMLRYGLEPQARINAWKSMYDDYVPLRGWEDAPEDAPPNYGVGAQFNVRGPEVRQALGRKSRAENPLVNLLDQAYRVVERGERNRYLISLHNALAGLPYAMRADIATLNRGRPKRTIDPRTGLATTIDDWADRNRPEAVHYKIRGESRYMVFKSRELAEGIKRMTPYGLGSATILLRAVNKLKAAWTHMNPEFLLRHFFARYPIEGLLNAQELKDTGAFSNIRYLKDAFPMWGRATRAILDAEAGRTGGSPARQQLRTYWEEMKREGGALMFRQMRDTDLLREHMQAMLRDLTGRPDLSVREKFRRFVEGMDQYTGAMDNSLRLAVYAQARDQGMDPQKAALRARDATIDYQLRARWSNILGLFAPFFNTAMRTGTRMTGALVRSARMRRVFLGVMGAGLMLSLWNYLMGSDDNGKPFYEKIAPWDREGNIIILNPFTRDAKGRPQPIKIPMPYNYRFPMNLGRVIGSAFMGKETWGDRITSILKTAATAFTPFGEEANVLDWVTPEVLRTPAHIFTNKNWTGAALHADVRNQKGPNAYSPLKGPRGAKGAWETIAQGANAATGGSRTHSGLVDLHPEDYREIFDQFFGAQRRFAGKITDTAGSIMKGEPPAPAEVPLTSVFFGTDYDKSDKAEAAHRKFLSDHPWLR